MNTTVAEGDKTGRNVWIQRFTWDEGDMPVLGRPSFGTV